MYDIGETITWVIEFRPAEGQVWPDVQEAFRDKRTIRPVVLALTVDIDDVDNQQVWLDVRRGYNIRKNGSVGAQVGQFATIDARDMPDDFQRDLTEAVETLRAKARKLRS